MFLHGLNIWPIVGSSNIGLDVGSTRPLVEHPVFLHGLNIWLIVGSSNIGLAFGQLNVCRPLP